MKKMIALFLALIMALSMFSFQLAGFAEETAMSAYQTEIDFLEKIGLLDSDFAVGKALTREYMAKLVISAIYPEVDFSVEGSREPFADVPPANSFYSYIKACKELGIVNGDDKNCFRPGDTASVTEMLTVMINAMGYTPYAQAAGGYPSGYFSVAFSSGISKGIDLSAETCTTDAAAKMLYNAIFADSVALSEISGDGEISVTIDSKKNFIGERLGIYEYDAVITDNGYASIYGDSVEDPERIVIMAYKTNQTITAYVQKDSMIEYLGYRMRIFLRNNQQTGRYEVVFAAPHSKIKTLTIKGSEVIRADDSGVEYEKDSNQEKNMKISFSAVRPKMLFNGAVVNGETVSEMIPKDGLLTFIDNDGDNKYDFINVLSFNYHAGSYHNAARNIVVGSVTAAEGDEYISCQFNPANSLDLDSSKYGHAFVMSDSAASLNDLKNGMILSVAECPEAVDGKPFYYLVASDKTAAGTVSSIAEPDEIYLEGTEKAYHISSSITSVKSSFLRTVDYAPITLYLDATGKIAYTTGASKSAKDYAYLIGAELESGLEECVKIKVFTKEETIEVLPLKIKATIDGKTYSTPAEQLNALLTRSEAAAKIAGDTGTSRPILLKKNSDGYVTKVDTDTPNNTDGGRSEIYLHQTSIPYTQEEADDPETLKAGYRNAGIMKLQGAYKSMNGKFFVTLDTTIMAVPDIDTYGLEDSLKYSVLASAPSAAFDYKNIQLYELEEKTSNYKLLKPNDLASDIKYDIQAYDIDPDTHVAGFAVVRGLYHSGIEELAWTYPTYVFLKKTLVYDEAKQKNITKLYYHKNGVEDSVIVDTDECYYMFKAIIEGASKDQMPQGVEVESLHPGDVIRVAKNSDGSLKVLERVSKIQKYEDTWAAVVFALPAQQRYTRASDIPYDTRAVARPAEDTYTILTANAETLKNGIAELIVPRSYTSLRSTIDLSNPSTYNKMYLNFAGVPITTATFAEDGSLRAKKGSLDDIVTLDRAGDTGDQSLIICKYSQYVVEEIIVYNGLKNMK